MKVIDSVGTKIYIVYPFDQTWFDCNDAIAGFLNEPMLECPQSIGDLIETRAVTEYKCMDSNISGKSLGSVQRSNTDIQVLFDPDSTEQLKFSNSFKDVVEIAVGIMIPGDTLYWFKAIVSGISSAIPLDEAIMQTFTVEIMTEIKECDASNPLSPCATSIGNLSGTEWQLSALLKPACVLCKA